MRLGVFALTGLGLIVFWADASAPVPPRPIEYNRDIRPILAENCFACHGPDSAARKADLRLDEREAAVNAEAIVPGKPDASGLIERIFATDAATVMPPPASHKTLTPAQKELLKKWVAAGAEYQPHWSFIAPRRPAVPADGGGWARNPIDHFVLAKLKEAGLTPAPEADRRSLARRLSYDLTGLPPEPADVEAFVRDAAPDWYEKYVDRLMQSPHWGEHRGRYWLDAARYADTHGIHFDNYREMWSYRDWVIRAFNENMPFDRFTVEQLAGDLLPEPTLDQRVATGFNRCNITTNEGGAINEEYLVLYTRDRTETAATVFLGLTAGCAVCHDHKLDPVSQREFYQLSAFFNNTTQGAMDGNVHNTPPIVTVPRSEDRPRFDAVAKELAAVTARQAERKKSARVDFDRWQESSSATTIAESVPADPIAELPLTEAGAREATVRIGKTERKFALTDGYAWTSGKDGRSGLRIQPGPAITFPDVGDFDADTPFSIGVWVRSGQAGQSGAILGRMNMPDGFRGWDLWMQGGRVGSHIIHHWPDNALKVVANQPIAVNKWVHVTLAYDGSRKASGIAVYYDGQPQPVTVEADHLTKTTRTSVPLAIGQRNQGDRVNNIAIQDVRVFGRAVSPRDAAQLAKASRVAAILAKADKDRSPAERDELYNWWLAEQDSPYRELAARADALRKEDAEIRGRGTIAHVMQESNRPATAYILHRGEYDQRRDQVAPGTPRVLPPFPADAPKNRLGFAQWLLQPDHPLTARVTVNRFWQELFGQGFVRTAGDFGIAGELPSHPELLDWLAVEFRESGWDTRKFFKLLVGSATYRQATLITPEKREKDPFNRLLSRGPRFRMDAEMIRDSALAASGLLVRKVGGPSVRPYQPEGVWEAVAMIGSNTRDYKRDNGENLYRRSMYTFWKRAAPPASMDIFNAPNRETCAVRRERTNTPLQALVTLNDPQFVEAARNLAEKALKLDLTDTATVDWITTRLLARPLTADEHAIVARSLDALLKRYRAAPADATRLLEVGESKRDGTLDPAQHAAWTMLCNQLMNLDEALCK